MQAARQRQLPIRHDGLPWRQKSAHKTWRVRARRLLAVVGRLSARVMDEVNESMWMVEEPGSRCGWSKCGEREGPHRGRHLLLPSWLSRDMVLAAAFALLVDTEPPRTGSEGGGGVRSAYLGPLDCGGNPMREEGGVWRESHPLPVELGAASWTKLLGGHGAVSRRVELAPAGCDGLLAFPGAAARGDLEKPLSMASEAGG